MQEDKRFWTEWHKAFPEFNLLSNSSWMQFWFLNIVHKYLNFATLPKNSLAAFILSLYEPIIVMYNFETASVYL